MSSADTTTPYAPVPTALSSLYLLSTSNLLPEIVQDETSCSINYEQTRLQLWMCVAFAKLLQSTHWSACNRHRPNAIFGGGCHTHSCYNTNMGYGTTTNRSMYSYNNAKTTDHNSVDATSGSFSDWRAYSTEVACANKPVALSPNASLPGLTGSSWLFPALRCNTLVGVGTAVLSAGEAVGEE